jgi:hypothetical protein
MLVQPISASRALVGILLFPLNHLLRTLAWLALVMSYLAREAPSLPISVIWIVVNPAMRILSIRLSYKVRRRESDLLSS